MHFRVRPSAIALLVLCAVLGSGAAWGQSDAATRSFEHALGVAEIPTNPTRVAVLSIIALDATLSTGVVPVAALLGRDQPWRTDIDAIEVLFTSEVDIEGLLATRPDLILSGAFDGELFDGLDVGLLERIAPVVAFDFESDNAWPEYFLFFADALGRIEQGQRIMAAYEARVAEVREALGDDDRTVALLRVRPESLRNQTNTGFAARVFDDLGLPTWDLTDWAFSLERIIEIDADVIYVFGSENDPEVLSAELAWLTSTPVWQSHPAVRSGDVHVVGSHWFGFGPTEAGLVLDDLERTLTVDDAE